MKCIFSCEFAIEVPRERQSDDSVKPDIQAPAGIIVER